MITLKIPLSKITTFQDLGIVSITWIESLMDISTIMNEKSAIIPIGQGSNLVINPNTSACLIKIKDGLIQTTIERQYVQVNAGMHASKLLKICLNNQLSGLEFIAGVPTSVGGMVAMNFGCFGCEISDYIDQIYIADQTGECRWIPATEALFSYRTSIFQQNTQWIILAVRFKLKNSDTNSIAQKIHANIQIRKEKQPLGQKTFGSIFKNPPHDFAGRILENCGYLGKRYKTMKIFEKHANFLINMGHSTFEDIQDFLHLIQTDVQEKTGIQLDPEVRIIP